MASVRILGPGRAGTSFALALEAAGWDVDRVWGRDDDPRDAAAGVDLVLVCTPDASVASTASRIEPAKRSVIAHVAGSLGLDALGGHERRASVHPLVPLVGGAAGARRLRSGRWFAVAGDPIARDVVASLGGRAFEVADADRVRYHAAAAVASNHLVALLGQVERMATAIAVPFDAYLDLVRATVDNVEELGARAALTGPAARGDDATIARHLDAIDPSERDAYEALVAEARRLAGR